MAHQAEGGEEAVRSFSSQLRPLETYALTYSYNPILGEIFRCRYDYADGTVGYYIAEQVSHHPPISAWYVSPLLSAFFSVQE
jgi:hypothetical protein